MTGDSAAMPRLFKIVALLLTLASLAGCGVVHDKEAAASAMDEFHDRFNAGQFDKIYDTAGADFQGAMARTEFLQFITAVHRKLGDYKTCKNKGSSNNTSNGDTSVTLRYETKFTKGTGDEEFVFHVAGTRATLRGWHINSNALIGD